MKPNPHRTLGARLLISLVLNCWSPLLADSRQDVFAAERPGHAGWISGLNCGDSLIVRGGRVARLGA